MRVRLRRLRAALSLFKEPLQGSDVNTLKVELLWLTKQLGPARDFDVMISKALSPLRTCKNDQTEFASLESDLDEHRKAGLATAKAAMESERFRRLLLDTALRLFEGDRRDSADALQTSLWMQPIVPFARQELTRRLRTIAKRVRKLRTMDPRRKHRLRIAVKKVRYAREFFKSLKPDAHANKRASAKIDRPLRNLQSALGSLNDRAVHGRLARGLARINPATRKAYAIGYLTGQEDVRSGEILSEAVQAAKRLRDAV